MHGRPDCKIDQYYFDVNQKATKHYREEFIKIAGSENDSVDLDGLGKLVKLISDQEMPRELLESVMREIDLDNNNSLEYNEFVIAMKKIEDTEDELKDVFMALDKNSSCWLTPESIRHFMMALGEKITVQEIKDIIFEFDTSREGKLNFNDFKMFFRGDKDIK